MPKYIYVMVRENIPKEQIVVQAAHATYEAGRRFGHKGKPPHLILIGCKDEFSLLQCKGEAQVAGIESELFFEPDEPICGYTAFCTEPIGKAKRFFFRKFKLFSF